jgi:hypothetical protein
MRWTVIVPTGSRGLDPPARWWSITAYGADDFLIPNTADSYSASMNSVTRRKDGTFAVTLSQQQPEGDWIPVAAGHFDLTIRLYNPQAEVAADLARVVLPTIKKIACKWIAAMLLVAAAVRAATLLLLPRFVMLRTMAGMTKLAGAANTITHAPRATWRSRGVVRPSPDLLYSFCVYDLGAAGGAVRVSAHDMPQSYWSVPCSTPTPIIFSP